MNTYIWLVRREFWENRAIWVIPIAIGAFMVLCALFGRTDLMAASSQAMGRSVGQAFMGAVGATFFVVMSIYAAWYLLDCLYADRKDRSVLFWKSLPISDAATVLSKLATAVIVIPLVYFAAADLTTLLVAFIISVRAGSLVSGALWQASLWLQIQALWLYLILTTAVWYLPVTAYLLLISSWAKRAVTLWSILPPLALILGERWFFGTRVIAHQLGVRLFGYTEAAFNANLASWASAAAADSDAIRTPADIWSFVDFAGFFSSMATWAGAAAGVVLIIGSIQLRMRRTEI
jgi:ABC-2 type transport system permease protein